jgi:hypothetical protein
VTPHRRWTQSDITDLRRRLLADEAVAAVAGAAQRSEEDVRRMAVRLGLLAPAPL